MKTITYDDTQWKLVPVEPTEAMADAAVIALAPISYHMSEFHCSGVAYKAMLASAPAHPPSEQGDETGWLVENCETNPHTYLRLSDAGSQWVTPDKATRFCRREDANHAAEGGELLDLIITEHKWVSA